MNDWRPSEFDDLFEQTNDFVHKAIKNKEISEEKLKQTLELINRSINDYCRIADSLKSQSQKWNKSAERFAVLRDTLCKLLEETRKGKAYDPSNH